MGKEYQETRPARIEWIDCAKGVAILAIIAGHLYNPVINRLVFPWHVPLFFIVAGFFLSVKSGIGVFLKRKARALLVPYVLTAVIITVVMSSVGGMCHGASRLWHWEGWGAALYGAGNDVILGTVTIPQIGAIWFLEALFIALLLARICMGLRYGTFVLAAIAILSWWSARYVWLPLNIQAGGLGAMLVYIGNRMYRQTDLLEKPNWALVVCGMVWYLYEVVFDWELFLVRNCCTLWNFFGSVLIVYAILMLVRGLSRFAVFKCVFAFLGTHSLVILCVHLFELRCMPWDKLFSMLPCMPSSGALRVVVLYCVKVAFATVVAALIVTVRRNTFHPRFHEIRNRQQRV